MRLCVPGMFWEQVLGTEFEFESMCIFTEIVF